MTYSYNTKAMAEGAYAAKVTFTRSQLGFAFLPVRLVTMRAVLESVAERHGLTVDDLRGPRRNKAVAHPRQEAMWRIRQIRGDDGKPKYSLPQIGIYLGERDHSTIIHGIRRYEARAAAARRK